MPSARKSVVNVSKDECGACGFLVEDQEEAFLCDSCGTWEHLRCSTVDKSTYESLMAHPTLQITFSCATCLRARRKQQRSRKKTQGCSPPVEDTTSNEPPISTDDKEAAGAVSRSSSAECPLPQQNSVDGGDGDWVPVQKRKAKKAKKATGAIAGGAVQEAVQHTVVTTEVSPANVVRPLSRYAPRENCLLFFNIMELEDGTTTEKLDHDSSCLSSAIQKMLTPTDEPIQIKQLFRVGSKGPSETGCRPLKVIFPEARSPKFLLTRSYRLKGTKISVRPDLSLEDRDRLRAAVAELRTRTLNGEKDLMIVNFRVVRRRKLLAQPLVVQALPA